MTVQKGDRYGRLVVVGYGARNHRWWCRCDCGRLVERKPHELVRSPHGSCRRCCLDGGPQKRWGNQPIGV